MHDLWPASGFTHLARTPAGRLRPSDAYLRRFLAWPELALVPESCAAERALHAALVESPSRAVTTAELQAARDPDARANLATFLGFRDALLAAGTLEAWYLALMRSRQVALPPAFIADVVQAIAQGLVGAGDDAFEARAAELLFRPQQLARVDGRLLCADRQTLEQLGATAGLGEIGRLLVQGKVPLRAHALTVLGIDNASDYWRRSDRHDTVLDLTHEISNDLGHGLHFTMARRHSGLAALARVLQRWVVHFLGAQVTITPLQRIDDAAWRWHVGLDAESMALLNDLYDDRAVAPERMQRLISLFRLDFADPAEMHPDVEGRPVYLGLAMDAGDTLTLKPQNLLLNLPLAPAA